MKRREPINKGSGIHCTLNKGTLIESNNELELFNPKCALEFCFLELPDRIKAYVACLFEIVTLRVVLCGNVLQWHVCF